MSSPRPITTLFHGQDEPRLKDAVARFIADVSDPENAGLNTTRLDGRSIQPGEIESAGNTLPFLSDVRLIVVENLTEAATGRDLIDDLPDILASLPDSTRLVFIETGMSPGNTSGSASRMRARKSALKKLINVVEADSRGKVESFGMPQNPTSWILQRAEHYEAQIEPDAARELADRIGENLVLADMELVKLATYASGEERPIQKTDVQKLTPYTPEANIFNMVDALGQRRGDVALRLLRKLIDDGDEPLRVFGMIVRQYRLLLQMKEQLEQGRSVKAAGKAIDIHPYVAEKISGQARYYSLDLLERIYHYLLELDLAMKGQALDEDDSRIKNMDPEIALESLVTLLAGSG